MKVLHVFTIPSTAISFFDGQFGFLSDQGHDIHMVSSAGEIEDFCKRNKVTFYPIEIARRIDLVTDFKSISQLCQLIRKEHYDAVFGHTPKGALVAMIAAQMCGTTIRVYYRHGLIYTTAKGIKRRIFKTVEQFTSLLSNRIINVSQSLSELAIADHLNINNKQTCIGEGTCGGIDAINVFNPDKVNQHTIAELKNRYGLDNTDYIIGFCGRICKDKGIEELVDGFKLFHSANPNISSKLLLVGDYDKRDILNDSVKEEISQNPNIIHIGKVDRNLLPGYYSLMDVFVFPSYREGFGMSVIEASAMEIPILVSRSHGCINSIVEGTTGEYIDIDKHDIAKRLETMQDKSTASKYGKSGRQWTVSNFDYTVMWPKISRLYKYLENGTVYQQS